MKKEIAEIANKNEKIFEINIKYKVPDEEFIRLIKENNVSMVIGSDAHDTKELEKVWRFSSIKGYPESFKIMKENPDYQEGFK